MPIHNPALLLLWKVAAIEASLLESEYIEPIHFLLAALKTVDIDINATYDSTFMPPEDVEKIKREFCELQNIFSYVGINPKYSRRKLRKIVKGEYVIRHTKGSNIIHRSYQCKEIFKSLESKINLYHESLTPILLINGILFELQSKDILFLQQSGVDVIKFKSYFEEKSLTTKYKSSKSMSSAQSNVSMAIGYFELSMYSEAESYIEKCTEEELMTPKIIEILKRINQIKGI
jgi:hypothetical protein